MAGFRFNGPLGYAYGVTEFTIDGTLALCASPAPQLLCSVSDTGQPEAVRWLPSMPDPIPQLFNACLNPKTGLSNADLARAATRLDVEVAVIRAVAQVEAPGGAFDDFGRPTILYERHYFHRLTAGKHDKKHPDLSNASQGDYGKLSAQYSKLERAYKLNASAALKSCSWGRFQIMGANYDECGFGSVEAFVRSVMQSEANQLDAFVTFLNHDARKRRALKQHDWAVFARLYNGPSYADNGYDSKLEAAFDRFSKAETEK